MVVLQSRLEGGAALSAASTTASLRLFHSSSSRRHIVVHKPVVLLVVLLASPDSPAYQPESTKNDGTTNTNNDADDGISSLGGHTRSLTVPRSEARRGRRLRGARHGLLDSIASSAGKNNVGS